MVATSQRVDGSSWITTICLALVVPVVLFSVFMFVSRFAVRSLYGSADFPALFLSAAVGTIPIFRSRHSILAKLCFAVLYIAITVTVLGMSGWWFDCLILHDCD